MCGIAGLVGREDERVDAATVRQMCATIVHRGPDDEGVRTLSVLRHDENGCLAPIIVKYNVSGR